MTIKAILFDKDGTLIDFMGTFGPATAKVINDLAQGNQELAEKIAQDVEFDMGHSSCATSSILIAGSLEDIARRFAIVLGQNYSEQLRDHVDQLFVRYSTESLTSFAFTEKALDTLLDMNLTLGVATNDSENGALAHLNAIAISDRFKFIAGYDSGHGAKPEPGMVSAFINELGLQPDEVAMVGDSTHDLMAGRAAGAIAIAVTSGEADEMDLAPYADHVLDHIGHLPALIKTQNESAS